MNPLHIVAFLDGRPGHEKQTRGVVTALEHITAVTVRNVRLPRSTLATDLKNWAVYLATAGLRVGRCDRPEPVDLIIGTGSATHIPMLRFKGTSRAKVVTCMTPDALLLGRIDLCLVPHHDQPRARPNIFMTIGPPGLPRLPRTDSHQRSLILVGGRDEKSHIWQTDAVLMQIENLVTREPEGAWTVTSSPRTPPDCEARLQDLAAKYPHVAFYRAQDTPTGWIEAAYACNATAWVTADSISMIYEALTAGCRVGILPVVWKRSRNKFQRSIDYLYHRHMVMTYQDWLHNAVRPVEAGLLDEASRCAGEILRRWWPDRRP
jgi:mitochondrial fission protein ELM1